MTLYISYLLFLINSKECTVFVWKEQLGWNIGQTDFREDKSPVQLHTGLKFSPVFFLMGLQGHHMNEHDPWCY